MLRLPSLVAFNLWLVASVWAGQPELDRERTRLTEQGKSILNSSEEAQLATRGWRDRRLGEFDPPVSALSRPADYLNDMHRGTVEFRGRLPGERRAGWRNYSYHRVKIPSGTIIDGEEMGGCNFTQIAPNTDAISRLPGIYGHNLTFRHCNLTNLKTYADWTLIDCNNAQVERVPQTIVDPETGETHEEWETRYISQRSIDIPVNYVIAPDALQ